LKAIPRDGPINFHDIFLDVMSERLVATIMPQFRAKDVQAVGVDPGITWTILYYFGVFTHGKQGQLRLPNATMKKLVRVALILFLSY
jgi:hypothetical protein